MPMQNPPNPAFLSRKTQSLEVRNLIGKLLERIWIFLAIILCTTVIAAISAFKATPIYQATSTLQVEDDQKLLNVQEVSSTDFRTMDALNTFAQRILTKSVLTRVVHTNRLAQDQDFLKIYGKNFTNTPSEEMLVKGLAGIADKKLRRGTRLIDVSVDHPVPAVAKKLADSIAQEFIREKVSQQLGVNTSANQVLQEEAARLKKKLLDSEKLLQAYKEKNQTSSFGQSDNVTTDKVRKFSQNYLEAKGRRLQLEADLKEFQKPATDIETILSLPTLQQDPAVTGMRQQLLAMETQVASMTNRYKPLYPKMVQANQALADLRVAFKRLVDNAPQLVKADLERALARENSLKFELETSEKEALALTAKNIEYQSILRDVESDTAMFESVLKRIKETDVVKGLDRNTVSILEEASRPEIPVRPDRKKMILTGLMIGFLINVALFFVLEKMDSTVRTVDEAERDLGVPVLGAIPRSADNSTGTTPLVLESAPHSSCSESFRSFRASIEMLGREEDRRVLLFTSSVPGEGKSFTSINTAFAMAQQGKKVLLIDLDLRRPAVARYLKLDENGPGVTNYLLGKAKVAELAQEASPNFFIMTAGPRVPNPAEHLSGKWIEPMIKEAASQFDLVVIDTAPLNAVSDTLYLLPYIQHLFIVVRAGKTSLPGILRLLEQVRRSNYKVTGVVLNYLPESTGYGNYYYSSESYSAKGVYGAPK